MLTDREVRWRLLAVAGLSALLVSLMIALLLPPRHSEVRAGLHDLSRLFATSPERLPGSPAQPASSQPTPAPLVGEEAIDRNARDPFVSIGPAAEPYRFTGTPLDRARARLCLAAAMLYEAGNDPTGQFAVGQVVLNRARHPAFPASVCGVVAQGSDRATGCQFTFTCDGALARRFAAPARSAALFRADLMLSGLVYAGVGLATHYHTTGVYPWWSPKLDKIAQVGTHLFFRWPGYWGSPRAMVGKRSDLEPSAALFAFLDPLSGREVSAPEAEPAAAGGVPAPAGPVRPTAAAGPREHGGVVGSAADALSASPLIPATRRLSTVGAREEGQSFVVGDTVLSGNRLLRAFPEAGLYFIEVAPNSNETSRRRAAELLCGGRDPCEVYGWASGAQVPAGPMLDAAGRRAAAFVFRRAKGSEKRAPSLVDGPR